MCAPRNLLIAAVLLAAPLAGTPAEVPTPLGEAVVSESARIDREYEEAIRGLREAMLQTGDPVQNWDVGGADVETAIRALGADKYYLLETDPADGTMVVSILTERPVADFAPATWRVAESFGSAETKLESPTVSFVVMTARYVVGGRAGTRRARDAACTEKIGHAILYEVPGAPSTPEDADMPDIFAAMMLALEGQTICSRYDGSPDKGYSVRDFLPDGRLLLNPDRSVRAGRAAIVPAAPVDSLIKPPPPPPATPPR